MIQEDFDSKEEWEFYNWLLEAERHGLISGIEYHSKSYELSVRASVWTTKKLKTKTKEVEKFLLHPHSYTPDFVFKAENSLIYPFFVQTNVLGGGKIIIDVKGNFAGRNNTTAITFPINQKWVYDKFGKYVQKVVPEKLFKQTWVSEEARLSPKKKQPVKKYIECKNVNEFIGGDGS